MRGLFAFRLRTFVIFGVALLALDVGRSMWARIGLEFSHLGVSARSRAIRGYDVAARGGFERGHTLGKEGVYSAMRDLSRP